VVLIRYSFEEYLKFLGHISKTQSNIKYFLTLKLVYKDYNIEASIFSLCNFGLAAGSLAGRNNNLGQD